MKQAILVMNNGGFDTLQQTIKLLDDKDIDFYVYSKSTIKLKAKESKIFFVGNNKKIHSQTFKELLEEKKLIDQALNGDYEYFHLISSNDFPMMSKSYFKKYFESKPIKLGFVEKTDTEDYQSLSFYYPFNNFNYSRVFIAFIFVRMCMALNHILHIKRITSDSVFKGCPYFSLPRTYVEKLAKQKIDNYRYTINPKNFFAQTTMKNLKKNNPEYTINSSRYNLMKAYNDSSRYVNYLKTEKNNWFDEKPYKFTSKDKIELKKIINTQYAFVHFVGDSDKLKSLFN
ncbi:MAG: hypothetical protein M3001_09640 [Staphylococcus epidermidis]|nr:hypothetical protein [Staphylococcus epidermidis]